MKVQLNCSVCKTGAQQTSRDYERYYFCECPQCGSYEIAKNLLGRLEECSLKAKGRISGAIRRRFDNGEVYRILTLPDLERLLNEPIPQIMDRARILLKELCEATTEYNEMIYDSIRPEIISRTYSANFSEVLMLLTLLGEQGFIKERSLDGGATISAQGFVENERAPIQMSDSAFVAMWFSEEVNKLFSTGFERAVSAAGYNAVRIDKIDHNNKIDDEIIIKIRDAKFVIADFTGHRGGVYFEAGFAMGLGKPVIFTCRKDHLEQLHFDVRQFNTIDWESVADLTPRLELRIRATIGEGPRKVFK